MANVIVAQRMWQRRDTAANWASLNPLLAAGEIGVVIDTDGRVRTIKIGDGVRTWTSLPQLIPVTTTDLPEGTNKYYTDDRARAAPLTGLATPAASLVAETDSVLAAAGKLQSQISAAPGKNLLINADMQVNQRVFGGGALAAGVYGYDRWKAGSGGCNVSVSSAGVITHASGPLVQVVESPPGVYGRNVTLSVEDPSGSIAVSVGSVSGTITAGSGRRGVTLAISSGGSGNLTVQLTATNVTYRLPQLERGNTATAFEYRPAAVEVILCKRYYEKSYPRTVKAGTVTEVGYVNWFFDLSANGMSYMVPFQVEKAGTPAVTLYSPTTGAAGRVRDVNAGVDVAASVGGQGPSGFRNYYQPQARPSSLNLGHQWVAEAEL